MLSGVPTTKGIEAQPEAGAINGMGVGVAAGSCTRSGCPGSESGEGWMDVNAPLMVAVKGVPGAILGGINTTACVGGTWAAPTLCDIAVLTTRTRTRTRTHANDDASECT